jgi:hypothetical protein
MMIPNDSNHPPQFSPSISENIDSLAQMLLSTSLSYEQETCQFLLEKIKEKISLTPQLQGSLEQLEEIVQGPSTFEPYAVQQALSKLRGID